MKNMKKLLALALVIISVFAISIPAMAATTMYIDCTPGQTVKLRNTATDTVSNVLTSVSYSMPVQATDYNSSWKKVTYTNKSGTSFTGYIMSSFLTTTGPWIARYGSATLQEGSKGSYVKQLQKDLMDYDGANLTPYYADGDYGPGTFGAVFDFQGHAGLVKDGVCGAKTKEALFRRVYPLK